MPLKIKDTSINADGVEVSPETFYSRYNQAWRVTGVSGGRSNISAAGDRHTSLKPNPFKVDCYYIDFHGRFYRPTVHSFEISPYLGKRRITDLPFYPLKFMDTKRRLKQQEDMLDRGQLVFAAMAKSAHFFYRGPTLMCQPCGCKIDDGKSPLFCSYEKQGSSAL